MKIQKSFFILSILAGMMAFGAGMDFVGGGSTQPFAAQSVQTATSLKKPSMPTPAAKFQPSGDESVEMPAPEDWDIEAAEPVRPGSGELPGVFRGDWGETLIYARHDRVNYEEAAYLSLENGNQNQPPSISPAFWRRVKNFKESDSENCLSPGQGVDLTKCDFSEETSLKDRNLNGAVLSEARLGGELGSADLSGANLSGAAVIGSLVISPDTRLEHANLSKLQSDGNNPLIAESANLSNTNFSEANLYGAKMTGADLAGADLTGATLTGAELAETRLEGVALSKANLTFANLSAGVLADAALSEADLTDANLADADFSRANLQQANLAGTELAGTDLSGADLRGANLTAAKNADNAIIDSATDFTDAICPDGVSVDGTQVTTCVGHGF
jgi:uncharacterized protein YjbI with pentapeptide repeats